VNTKPQSLHVSLNGIYDYSLARAQELQKMSREKAAWFFLCASAFIDFLARLTSKKSGSTQYKAFIEQFMPERYSTFVYQDGTNDLPKQMYHTLRCGILHSFSFVPDEDSKKRGARERSIVLTQKSREPQLRHLQNYPSGELDAACFVAEDFANDIMETVHRIFKDAQKKPQLKNCIISRYTSHPPLQSIAPEINVLQMLTFRHR
jgi:hypothetical protein